MNNFRKFLEGYFLKMDEAGDDKGGGGGGSTDDKTDDKGGDPDPNPGDDGGKKDDPNDDKGDDTDDNGWDDKTKAYVKKLRSENAKYRTGKKESDTKADEAAATLSKVKDAFGLGGDEVPLEEQLQSAQEKNAQNEFSVAVRDIAIEQGVSGKDAFEYFEFLMEKKARSLGDDEEITDEDIEAMVEKAKKQSGSSDGGSFKTSTSSKKGDEGSKPPASNGGDTLGVSDFVNLDFVAEGQLFSKNPDLYKKLNAEAVAKNLL